MNALVVASWTFHSRFECPPNTRNPNHKSVHYTRVFNKQVPYTIYSTFLMLCNGKTEQYRCTGCLIHPALIIWNRQSWQTPTNIYSVGPSGSKVSERRNGYAFVLTIQQINYFWFLRCSFNRRGEKSSYFLPGNAGKCWETGALCCITAPLEELEQKFHRDIHAIYKETEQYLKLVLLLFLSSTNKTGSCDCFHYYRYLHIEGICYRLL